MHSPHMSSVGRFTYGHKGIKILSWGEGAKLRIGSFTSIASGCTVILGGNHDIKRVTTYPFGHIHTRIFQSDGKGHPLTKGDVRIGNDVWLGTGVTIMSGVTIGDGAVICANSHVIKDVAPYSITGGNPAKHIRFRFTEKQIQSLMCIKWWEWPVHKINTNMSHLCQRNINQFIHDTEKVEKVSVKF